METYKTPLAVAIFAEVISIFCALSIALFPNLAMRIFGSWTHGLNWELIWSPSFTAANLTVGFVSLFIFTYLATWVFVTIYKAIVK